MNVESQVIDLANAIDTQARKAIARLRPLPDTHPTVRDQLALRHLCEAVKQAMQMPTAPSNDWIEAALDDLYLPLEHPRGECAACDAYRRRTAWDVLAAILPVVLHHLAVAMDPHMRVAAQILDVPDVPTGTLP